MPDYIKGQLIIVKSCESKPIAIGKLEMDVSNIKAFPQKKGKALKILHYFGDELWNLGSEFTKTTTDLIEDKKEVAEARNDEEKKSDGSNEIDDEGENEDLDEDNDEDEDDKDENEDKDDNNDDNDEDIKVNEINTKDTVKIDRIIYEAFMNALKISIKKTDLPMEPSVLINCHMKFCTKSPLEFQSSSYRKVRFILTSNR